MVSFHKKLTSEELPKNLFRFLKNHVRNWSFKFNRQGSPIVESSKIRSPCSENHNLPIMNIRLFLFINSWHPSETNTVYFVFIERHRTASSKGTKFIAILHDFPSQELGKEEISSPPSMECSKEPSETYYFI